MTWPIWHHFVFLSPDDGTNVLKSIESIKLRKDLLHFPINSVVIAKDNGSQTESH